MSESESNMRAVQDALIKGLKLESPRFLLEPVGSKVSGNVISSSFRGQRDFERQKRLWDALDQAFGAESAKRVGTLLAFTPEEWDLDVDPETEDSHATPASGGGG